MRGMGWGLVALGLCGLLACAPGPGADAAPMEFELLYDYRPLLAHQDLTGLEAGPYGVEFDVYVPRSEVWSARREQQLRKALRAAHVTTRTSAVTRLRFDEVPGRPDMRRVHLELDLDRPGAWVVRLSGFGVRPVEREPVLQTYYDILGSETLVSSIHLREEPSVLLLTVGACNHVSRMEVRTDARRVMRQLEFFFTEPVTQQAWASEVQLAVFDVERGHVATVTPQVARFSSESVVLDVPEWPDVHGRLEVSLGTAAGLAGGFGASFTCEPAATSVDVGYGFGSQDDARYRALHLSQAAVLAFEDPK